MRKTRIAAAVATIALLLSACGSGETPTVSEPASVTATETASQTTATATATATVDPNLEENYQRLAAARSVGAAYLITSIETVRATMANGVEADGDDALIYRLWTHTSESMRELARSLYIEPGSHPEGVANVALQEVDDMHENLSEAMAMVSLTAPDIPDADPDAPVPALDQDSYDALKDLVTSIRRAITLMREYASTPHETGWTPSEYLAATEALTEALTDGIAVAYQGVTADDVEMLRAARERIESEIDALLP